MLRTLILFFVFVSCAFSQAAASATLVGTVTDQSGANIVGAKVTATNIGTGFVTEGETNELGSYRLQSLNSGEYELRVESEGFVSYVRKGIVLRIGEVPRIDVQMELGSVTESVTITGGAPLLETETATSGAMLENKTFMEIPVMQMRTYNMLIYLPGVQTTGFGAFYSVGQRKTAMGYSIDGMSAREPVRATSIHHHQTVNTTMDALAEVKILTTGIPAEYGRAGSGMMAAVFKSGTNQLHGSLEDRFLSKDLIHRGYFDKVRRTTPNDYHEAAAVVNGPVYLPKIYDGRNKTFFLWSYQIHYENASEGNVLNVPSAEMLNGDVSFGGKGYPIFDPATTRLVDGEWVRDPFPGNQVPQNRFDPVTKNFLALDPYKAANIEGYTDKNGPHENFQGTTKYRSDRYRTDAKIDHQFNSKHRIFGRWSYNWHRRSSNRNYINFNSELLMPDMQPHPIDQHNIVLNHTWTINPTMINELRVGLNRRVFNRTGQSYGQDWAGQLGIPNVGPETFPVFLDTGYNYNPRSFTQTASEDITLSENLTKMTGPHTFKFGYEVFNSRYNSRVEDWPSGRYTVGGTEFPYQPNTGNGWASFLLGSVEKAAFTSTRATWLPKWWTHALYFQDSWKPNRNLTLNLGVRWTYETPYETKWGQQSQFDPNVVDSLTGKMGALTHPEGPLAKKDLNNFQPRIGMAWTFAPDFVFRGSFGINTIDNLSNSENIAFEEYFASASAQAPPGDPRPAFYLSQGPPDFEFTQNPDGTVPFVGTNYSGRSATWYDPNMRMPTIISWSGGFQWGFAQNWLGEVNYQGSSGVGLVNRWNINAVPLDISSDLNELEQIRKQQQNYKPYPHFGNINHWSNYGHSTYHGITFRVEKRFSHGFTLNAFYTFSKALNDGDNEGGRGGITFYNRALEKGRAGYDMTHRWVTVTNWDLPFGKGRKFMNTGGWKNAVFGGWRWAFVNTWQSGRPFTLSASGSPYKYLAGAKRPNIVASSFDEAMVDNWDIGPDRFPTSAQNPMMHIEAFEYAPAFTAGTLGRNTFTAGNLYWPQSSLSKRWTFGERFAASVRWDISNVFKLPQFQRPLTKYDKRNPGNFARYTRADRGFASIASVFHHIIVLRFEF